VFHTNDKLKVTIQTLKTREMLTYVLRAYVKHMTLKTNTKINNEKN